MYAVAVAGGAGLAYIPHHCLQQAAVVGAEKVHAYSYDRMASAGYWGRLAEFACVALAPAVWEHVVDPSAGAYCVVEFAVAPSVEDSRNRAVVDDRVLERSFLDLAAGAAYLPAVEDHQLNFEVDAVDAEVGSSHSAVRLP